MHWPDLIVLHCHGICMQHCLCIGKERVPLGCCSPSRDTLALQGQEYSGEGESESLAIKKAQKLRNYPIIHLCKRPIKLFTIQGHTRPSRPGILWGERERIIGHQKSAKASYLEKCPTEHRTFQIPLHSSGMLHTIFAQRILLLRYNQHKKIISQKYQHA